MFNPLNKDFLTFKDIEGLLTYKTIDILIVDNNPDFYINFSELLNSKKINERPVKISIAENLCETKKILSTNKNISIIFLDSDEEYLACELITFIKSKEEIKHIRIILTYSDISLAMNSKLVSKYTIADVKLKSELENPQILLSIFSHAQTYEQLVSIEYTKEGFHRVIESSKKFLRYNSIKKCASITLSQLHSILNLNKNKDIQKSSAFFISNLSGEYRIIYGKGFFKDYNDKNPIDVLSPSLYNAVQFSLSEHSCLYTNNCLLLYFKSDSNIDNLIFIDNVPGLSEFDINLGRMFCNNVSMSLDNIYLNDEIENTQKEIIYTLGEITETRSKETGNHVKRVAEYSKLLALKYGLSSKEAEIIQLSSPMHDVGKLAIPDIILNKPGKLTNEEFNIMKSHSKIGYEMLKNSHKPLMKTASIIALEHHERYDGTGYPYGLKGDSISIEGRITAVADVFDALGSSRSYKEAWDMESIYALLKDQKGRHFDPDLINIFFDNLKEFLDIKENYDDRFAIAK